MVTDVELQFARERDICKICSVNSKLIVLQTQLTSLVAGLAFHS